MQQVAYFTLDFTFECSFNVIIPVALVLSTLKLVLLNFLNGISFETLEFLCYFSTLIKINEGLEGK